MKNHIHLIGYAGQDPEIRVLDNGTKLARFSLATNEYYIARNGERKEETQWHQIVAWNKAADMVERLVGKGRLLNIDGKLVYRHYEDKDGKKRTVAEIRADEILVLDKRSQ